MHDSEDGGAAMEMPRYVSHKTVWALEIDSVSIGAPYRMKPKDAGFAEITLPAEMWSRYQPVSGDFYVQYADGYKSFSPRKAFLEGYSRVIAGGVSRQENSAEEKPAETNALELGAGARRAGVAHY